MAALEPAELRRRSAVAARLLFEQVEYQRAEVVMLFLSTPAEVDTSPIALQSWADFKRVLVPKVSWEQRRMMPVEIRSLTSDLKTDRMGIREPVRGIPIPITYVDLVVVPGLGFDSEGNRLGRGRGFYDRFLSHRDLHAVRCGLALEEQFVEHVPHDPHDVCLDMLVTDADVRRFRALSKSAR
jgi:5-formyltetrahydrofolate cyclo-ligase